MILAFFYVGPQKSVKFPSVSPLNSSPMNLGSESLSSKKLCPLEFSSYFVSNQQTRFHPRTISRQNSILVHSLFLRYCSFYNTTTLSGSHVRERVVWEVAECDLQKGQGQRACGGERAQPLCSYWLPLPRGPAHNPAYCRTKEKVNK